MRAAPDEKCDMESQAREDDSRMSKADRSPPGIPHHRRILKRIAETNRIYICAKPTFSQLGGVIYVSTTTRYQSELLGWP